MTETKWETYEQVARYLLDKFSEKFGLERVEGKQTVPGSRSGTNWEIDAKGIRDGRSGFLIVECRRYTTSKLTQEDIGGLAYRIMDTGADGGIIVSPFDLQEGAAKVAKAENVVNVILHPDSTPTEYFMRFLQQVFVGLHDRMSIRDSGRVQVIDKDGNIISEATF